MRASPGASRRAPRPASRTCLHRADLVESITEPVRSNSATEFERTGLSRNCSVPPLPDGRRSASLSPPRAAERGLAVGNVGHRLDDAIGQRGRAGSGAADGAGEAQPLGSIIVAVLEEVLDRLDPQPCAHPGRWQPEQCGDRGGEQAAHLPPPSEVPPKQAERLRDQQHGEERCPDQDQRQRLERDRAAGGSSSVRGPRIGADREQQRRGGYDDPAQRGQLGGRGPREPGDRVEIELYCHISASAPAVQRSTRRETAEAPA